MQTMSFNRQYVILRPFEGSAGGFIRLETNQGRLSAAVRATQVPSEPLRVLLLYGDPATGAVIDLGPMRSVPRRQASLYRENLPAQCTACHTVVVCSDWPGAQPLLYGCLTSRPVCTLWQLREITRRHLAVPACDAPHPAPPRLALCMVLQRR